MLRKVKNIHFFNNKKKLFRNYNKNKKIINLIEERQLN